MRKVVTDSTQKEAIQESAGSAIQLASSRTTTATSHLRPARILRSGAGLVSKESKE